MKTRILLLAALLATFPVHGRDKAFGKLVQRLQTHYQKAPMGTGFLGFLARCFSPDGIHNLRMAIFEDVDTRTCPLGQEFDAFVTQTVGPERSPFVKVRGRDGERLVIYLQPKGSRAELLLVAAEKQEAMVISLSLDPEKLEEWLDDPEGMARKKGKG